MFETFIITLSGSRYSMCRLLYSLYYCKAAPMIAEAMEKCW